MKPELPKKNEVKIEIPTEKQSNKDIIKKTDTKPDPLKKDRKHEIIPPVKKANEHHDKKDEVMKPSQVLEVKANIKKEVPAPSTTNVPPKSSKHSSQKDGSKTLSVEGVNSKSCDVKNNGLSVTEIQILDDKQEADRIFAQYKNRKRLFDVRHDIIRAT